MALNQLSRIVFLIIQVFLAAHDSEGCTDGRDACFRYFTPRETDLGSGSGICDLVADLLDCLTMVRGSCDPGTTAAIDGALNGVKDNYEGPNGNCTFVNIGQTPGYALYQCTKLFGDCKSFVTDTDCGLIDSYKLCVDGISSFCTSGNLQNVTNIINSEKQRLSAEQGCVFETLTTTRVLLSGVDCFSRFTTCFERQGVTTSSPPCVASPVYQTCLQTDVTDICDPPSTQTVASAVTNKQTECEAETTTSTESATTVTCQTNDVTSTLISTSELMASSYTDVDTSTTVKPETTTIAQPLTTATTLGQIRDTISSSRSTSVSMTSSSTDAKTSLIITSQITKTSVAQTMKTTIAGSSKTTPSEARSSTGYTKVTEDHSTKETIAVSEEGPGQIYLYYDSGSSLRCMEILLLLGIFVSFGWIINV